MTLEELMEENLKLKNEIDTLNTTLNTTKETIDKYKTEVEKNKEEMQKIRDLNMSLFLKVSKQKEETAKEETAKEETAKEDETPVVKATNTINTLIQSLSQF